MKRIVSFLCLSFLVMGCMPFTMLWYIPHGNEMVMSEGMSISIKNKTGVIRIEALGNLTRKFFWDGNVDQTKMTYREGRWFGNYGAYSPGGRSDVHIVIEEGQQHFCSQLEAEEWLMIQDPKMNYIFTKDGLAVGWYKEFNRIKDGFPDILLVDVIQVYISGIKPVDLANAQDSLFTVTFSKDYIDKVKIGQFQPSIPKMIGQRMYSGISIDIMKERGITAEQVENSIAKGEILKKGDFVSYIYFKRGEDLVWATIDKDGRVVLVGN
ncbi:MAG: DUF4258 domain-containing protein [bacterium]|nr:DUF4258 domain-containing protein [bacterium]